MAKIRLKSIAKDINKTAQKSAKAVKKAVENTIQDVKEIDLKEIGEDITDKARNLLAKKEQEEKESNLCISGKSASKIIYYLMAADGEIYHNEKEKYVEICTNLYPLFKQEQQIIEDECSFQISKVIDTDDHYDVLVEGIADAIAESMPTKDANITPKLLLWDLITVAYSDENYSENERRIIKYISRKLEISKTVFLEMESSIETLIAIEKELEWIKSTDRPYLQVEKIVNELAERKTTILDSVMNLITM